MFLALNQPQLGIRMRSLQGNKPLSAGSGAGGAGGRAQDSSALAPMLRVSGARPLLAGPGDTNV